MPAPPLPLPLPLPGPVRTFPLSLQEEMQNNVEVVHTYRQHIINDMNPGNLHLFINAYNRCAPRRLRGGCGQRYGSRRGGSPWT